MANSTAPLTDSQIRRSTPKQKQYNLCDGGGLLLRIAPGGSKAWLLNYARPATKKRTNLKLGEYPLLSLKEARKKRDECRKLLSDGIDPAQHKQAMARKSAQQQASTLKAVTDKWFKVHSANITPDYAEDIYASLANHVLPGLGQVPIHQISARDVIALLEPLQDQGKLELVKRISQRLNMVFDYAVIHEFINVNPVARISRVFKSPAKKNLPSISPAELPQLLEDIENASIKDTTRNLFKFQLLTMTRPSEAAKATWNEIDLKTGLWTLQPSRMKKRRKHLVPLNRPALQILQAQYEASNGEFVFPGDVNPRSHASPATVNMALRRAGYKGKLVGHGLRSIASSALHEAEFDTRIIEVQLSHVDSDATRAAYDRSERLEARRTMMEWWGEFVEAAASGHQPSIKKLRAI